MVRGRPRRISSPCHDRNHAGQGDLPARSGPLPASPARLAAIIVVAVAAVLTALEGPAAVAQTGVNGLALGSVYALSAVGLTLVYGILKLVNFTHGEFLTFGAYVAFGLNVSLGVPLVIAALGAVVATAVLGVAFELSMWRPMRERGAGMLQLLLMAIGLAFVVRYGISFIAGTESHALAIDRGAVVEFLGIRVGLAEIAVIGIGAVTLVLIGLMVRHTMLGKRMRAIADDPDLAETAGIDTRRVIVLTSGLRRRHRRAGGCDGGGGHGRAPELGFSLLLAIFATVILGGIGDVFGALAAGLVLGIVIEWSTLLIDFRYKFVVGFLVLILVLVIRPQGIFGRARAI